MPLARGDQCLARDAVDLQHGSNDSRGVEEDSHSAPTLGVVGGQLRVDVFVGQPRILRLLGGDSEWGVAGTRADYSVHAAPDGLPAAHVHEHASGLGFDRSRRGPS